MVGVLIVEADAAVLDSTATYLATEDYDIFQATDSTLALDLLYEKKPHIDVAILNLSLRKGGMDKIGLELAHQIHAFAPDLPIILTSSNPQALRGDERNLFTAIITKPYQASDLLEAIKSAAPRIPDDINRRPLGPTGVPEAQ